MRIPQSVNLGGAEFPVVEESSSKIKPKYE